MSLILKTHHLFAYCNFCEKAGDNWKIDNSKLSYFVTDRWGGSSRPPYEELNMGMNVGDCVDDVLYNRLLVAKHCGLPMNRFVFASQVHGDHIEIISEGDLSEDSYSVIKETDGLITADKNIALIILAADCVPVLVYDEVKEVVGAFHAGWRGLSNQIVIKGIQQMKQHYKCDPSNIKVFVGPSIGSCCYEIKNKVYEALEKSVPEFHSAIKIKASKTFVDLKKSIALQLKSQGISEKNIVISSDCTKCNSDTYFSYRSDQETGRFSAGIALWA